MDVITVSPIDNCQPRGYVRTLLCFPKTEPSDITLEQLNHGVKAVTARWPFSKGYVVSPDGYEGGRLAIATSTADDIELKIKDHRRIDTVRSYDSLAERRFPIAELDEKGLCSTPDSVVPGKVVIIQANFLKGGLVLSIVLHHGVFDGEGTRLFIEHFAKACRSGSNIDAPPCLTDRKNAFRACDSAPSRHIAYKSYREDATVISGKSLVSSQEDSESCSESRSADDSSGQDVGTAGPRDSDVSTSPKLDLKAYLCSLFSCLTSHEIEDPAPAHITAHTMTNMLVTFSRDELGSLKNRIVQSLEGLHDMGLSDRPSRLSTNDVLAALLWQGMTAARTPDATLHRSKFLMAVDCRSRVSPPIDPLFSGAVVVHNVAEEDAQHISKATTPETLGVLAMLVRASISEIDDKFVADTVAFANAFPDMREFGLRKTPHNDVLMTTWEKFAYQDMDFGGTLGHPQWARKPWSPQVADVVVLPKAASSDEIEVVLLLSEAQVERLKANTNFMQYVKRTST